MPWGILIGRLTALINHPRPFNDGIDLVGSAEESDLLRCRVGGEVFEIDFPIAANLSALPNREPAVGAGILLTERGAGKLGDGRI